MKINRKDLVTSLEAVRPGIASKEVVEQSTSFVFKAGRVYAYNDQIAISHAAPKGLEGAVSSKELHKLLTKMKEEEVDIETTETAMLISGRKSNASITLQSEITLPILDISEKKTWTALPEGFSKAVKFSLFSAGVDMTKPQLSCVNVDGKFIQTCDNFRLTRYTLPGKGIKSPMLIPASACAELIKYDPTHYAVDDSWAHFMNKEGTEFSCRVVEGKFPDLQSFIDKKTNNKLQLHEDTSDILDRAIVFLGDNSQYVKISIASNFMTIRADGNVGWFKEKARVDYKGELIEFMINPTFLKDMIAVLRDVSIDESKALLKFEGENFVHCCAVSVPEEKK